MRATNPKTYVLMSVLLVGGLCISAVGKTIYVDADAAGANDGSSWADAYKYLQDALADANSADKPVEIRVAQGIYKPDQGADVPYPPTWPANLDYRATFNLINGVTIKGGYAGFAEPDPNFRDIELYKTILSGDLNGDDVDVNDPGDLFDAPKRGDNSSNVVTGSNTDATAVLDGFIITAGYWRLPLYEPRNADPPGGAGMYISSGSPTIINCILTANATNGLGGGMNNLRGNPTLVNCTFTKNFAGRGGGIHNWQTSQHSNPILIDCTFNNNYTNHDGGGMYNYASNPMLTDCIFTHNSAFWPYSGSNTEGGGMYNRNSSPVLNDCTFIENSADNGGGMYNRDSNIVLNTCEFVMNTASRNGGAISTDGGQLVAKGCFFEKNYLGAINDSSTSGSMFTNCTFTGNASQGRDGAVRVYEATFSNCIFAGNRTFGYYWDGRWHPSSGGAVFNFQTTVFNNCTFIKNWADLGCAIYCFGTAHVNNCIFWGSEGQIYVDEPSAAPTFVRYSDVQGGWPGEGNINEDPLYIDPGRWVSVNDPNIILEPNDPNAVWVDGDYHLKSQAGRWNPTNQSWVIDDVTSPCIDAGDPNSPIGLEPFPNGGIINMGAYGGTAEASKSYFGEPLCETIIAGDINGDCKVDFADFSIMAAHWLEKR